MPSSATKRLEPPFVATPRQEELAAAWDDPAVRVVLAAGAIRSGKTAAGARLLIETAVESKATYLVCRNTFRELADSTRRAFITGDGKTPPLIPADLLLQFHATDNVAHLRNGSEILFRSLDEPSKLLGLNLAGALVDQAEEIDGGRDGEFLLDTIRGRLSDPRGPRKMLLITNPAGLTHCLYRRFVDEATRDDYVRVVHFSLLDNEANLHPDYVADMLATKRTRPSWYATYVEGRWGAFEGMAFSEFEVAVHVVEPFEIPEAWDVRFESLDHGANNPTAVLWWAVSPDEDVVVFDEYYKAGALVSEHAVEILERRKRHGTDRCYADPSIRAKHGLSTRWNVPASVEQEYLERGVYGLLPANNDRRAGYMRLLELLHIEPGRIAPPWANIPAHVGGAPRLYVFRTCPNLVAQLKSAPVQIEGSDIGECVDAKWSSISGHMIDALRYGAMSRPAPSTQSKPVAVTEEEMRQETVARLMFVEPDPDTPWYERENVYADI